MLAVSGNQAFGRRKEEQELREQRQTQGPDRAGFYYEQNWVDFSKFQAKNEMLPTFRKGQASLWGANGRLAAKVEAGRTLVQQANQKIKEALVYQAAAAAAAAAEKIARGG